MFGCAFYRNYDYKMVTHARVFSLKPNIDISENQCMFLSISLQYLKNYFGYENMCSWSRIKDMTIKLPTKNNQIDFNFMESFVSELKAQRVAELEAYLKITGLNDYELTEEENLCLKEFKNLDWGIFNLEDLFGKSTRGKRLKSLDRIPGALPFVTAGEADEGISSYVGNDIDVFSYNTTTIDMFGSAKYRNYKYGADDHIAVVHTEFLHKYASIFITSSIHKSSHNGQFNYSKNFYAKDADALNIMLPIKNNNPDYNFMKTFISAVQKIVIKDVVNYTDRKMQETKDIIFVNTSK